MSPMRVALFSVVFSSLLLVACSSTTVRGPYVQPPVSVAPAPSRPSGVPEAAAPEAPVQMTPETRRPQPARQLADGSQVPAVRGLVAAADGALARGEVELAAVNLERAQRLAPQSAQVYQKLATVRLRQKRPAEAEQLARKALAYASSPTQQAALWQLIARSRESQGQHALAREARDRAAALLQATSP